jgi:nucleotide-binding universal stress UspA family protein
MSGAHSSYLNVAAHRQGSTTTSIQRVLCPVDMSDCSRRALEYAAAIARRWRAELTVLHVHMSVSPYTVVQDLDGAAAHAADLGTLTLTVQQFVERNAGDLPAAVKLVHGSDPQRVIAEEVEAAHVDLLVVGSHGHGDVERFVLGSTSDRIVRRAPCPVLVVPPGATPAHDGRFRRLLCGIDFSPPSLRAFRYALHLAAADDADVTLLHAIEMPPELRDRQIAAAFDVDAVRAGAAVAARHRLAGLSPGHDVPRAHITINVRLGPADKEILAEARQRNADLIVLGTHGRNAVDRWLFGSNTDGVLRDAPCPVLTLRPE